MPKKSNAAERIVHATASLLASRGYFGTGLSDIIARAEAPKGSLYHYFPEGKPQIASAAIGFVADEVASFLDRAGTQAPHARNVLRQFTATLRGWLEHSRFEEACPVLSTTPWPSAARPTAKFPAKRSRWTACSTDGYLAGLGATPA